MKKNFLFSLLAVFLAGFGFGGVSMAAAVGNNCEGVAIDDEGKTVVLNGEDFEKSLHCNNVKEINLNSDIEISKGIVSTNYDNELTINLNSHNITSVVREGEDAGKHFYIELRGNFKIKGGENSKIALRYLDVYGTLVLISGTIESTDGELETNAGGAGIWINQGGNVEIKGGKVEGKGVYAIYNEGTLSIDGGEITSNYYTIYNNGTLSIDGGTLKCTNNINGNVIDNILGNIVMKGGIIEGGNTGIFIQGDGSDNSASLSIQGGEIKNQRSFGISGNGTYKEGDKRGGTKIEISDVEIDCIDGGEGCLAIYHPQDGTLDISGGKFKGQDSAIEIRAGKLNIGGGTFETVANGVNYSRNGNGNSVHGAAIAVSQHTTYLPIEVNISKGTFVGNTAFIQVDPEYDADKSTTKVETKITGGTFMGEVSIVKNENDNSENKSLVINGGIYSDLPKGLFTIPEGQYLKEQEDLTYQLADQTEISQIEVTGVTKPVAGATPTIEGITLNEGLTLISDETTKPTWKEGDNDITTFEANKTYTLTIPYTLNNSHKWADTVSVAGNDAKTAVKTSDTLLTLTYESAAGYTVTWKNGETVVETDTDVVINSKPEFNGSTPTKQADNSYTYSFKGWSKDGTDATVTLADEKITSDVTYTAVFNQTPKPTYSGGGGSSRSSSKTTTADDTKKAEDTSKADETKSDESKADESKANEAKTSEEAKAAADVQALKDGYSQEFIDAYNFARKNNITTKDTIREADMDAPLTRIAMAKMLSQYAINVLGKTPDTSKVVPNFPDVDEKLDADYNNGVTLAYQLGIMGIGIEEFRPFDLVTRAEFGTALSRMLFGLADGEGAEWYKTHLDKLMNEQIITNDNPNLKELRGYVMIMLMRSAQ